MKTLGEAMRADAETERRSYGAHESPRMRSDEWLTPPEIIKALGPFDLDPCSPVVRPWRTAKHHWNRFDDGLLCKWWGRVWLNPPYGRLIERWIRRLAIHGDGIALVFARTETQWFQDWIWPHAHGVYFLAGRLRFHTVDGRRARAGAGAPSVLIAYGSRNAKALRNSDLPGSYVPVREPGVQLSREERFKNEEENDHADD